VVREECRSAHGCIKGWRCTNLEQEVREEWRSVHGYTREFRCVNVRAGGCRRLEQVKECT
jgi:hypothetical protein